MSEAECEGPVGHCGMDGCVLVGAACLGVAESAGCAALARLARAADRCGRGRDRRPDAQSDWKIVERGWDAHVLGEAPNRFTDPVAAVKKLRVRVGVSNIALQRVAATQSA